MKHVPFLTSILISLVCTLSISPQIFAQTETAYKSSTLLISTVREGKLYFDGNYVNYIRPNIIIKLKGVPEGHHVITLKTASDSLVRPVNVETDQVYSFKAGQDSIRATDQKYQEQQDWTIVAGMKYIQKKKGYYNNTQVGTGSMFNNGIPSISLSTTHGYLFSPHFAMGIGAGCLFIESPTDTASINEVIVPVYAEARIFFMKTTVTPMLSFDIGYGINATKKTEAFDGKSGGLYLSAGCGFKWAVMTSLNINFSADMVYSQKDFNYTGEEKYKNSPGLIFKLGIGF